jgi:hypothetical protein
MLTLEYDYYIKVLRKTLHVPINMFTNIRHYAPASYMDRATANELQYRSCHVDSQCDECKFDNPIRYHAGKLGAGYSQNQDPEDPWDE